MAQLIPIVGSLIILRIFSASAFGFFSAWYGIVAIVAIAITFRFETSFPQERDGKDREVMVLGTIANTLFVFLCLLIAFLSLSLLFGIEAFLRSFNFLLLGLFASFLLSLFQIYQSWLASNGEYNKLNVLRIVNAFNITALQIIFGIFSTSAISLAIAFCIAGIFTFLVSLYLCKFRHLSFQDVKICLQKLWAKHNRFPKYSLPADFINTSAIQLPIIISSFKYSDELAGFLALTFRILGAPIGLIGKSLLDVFKRYAAQDYINNGNCIKI